MNSCHKVWEVLEFMEKERKKPQFLQNLTYKYEESSKYGFAACVNSAVEKYGFSSMKFDMDKNYDDILFVQE